MNSDKHDHFSTIESKGNSKNSNSDTINNHCLCDVLNLRDFRVGLGKNEEIKRSLYATHKGDHASK